MNSEPVVHRITELRAPGEPELTPDLPPETTADGRPLYWHVFGGPLKNTRGGSKNFPQFTAGPTTKGADDEVTGTTIPGTHGETFRYLGTFRHDPSLDEIQRLKPEEYR